MRAGLEHDLLAELIPQLDHALFSDRSGCDAG
jgi:hypothetical protein